MIFVHSDKDISEKGRKWNTLDRRLRIYGQSIRHDKELAAGNKATGRISSRSLGGGLEAGPEESDKKPTTGHLLAISCRRFWMVALSYSPYWTSWHFALTFRDFWVTYLLSEPLDGEV